MNQTPTGPLTLAEYRDGHGRKHKLRLRPNYRSERGQRIYTGATLTDERYGAPTLLVAELAADEGVAHARAILDDSEDQHGYKPGYLERVRSESAEQLCCELDGGAARRERRQRQADGELVETACKLLARLGSPEIHHAQWFQLLTRLGHRPDGDDPAGRFREALERSPQVRRGDRPGRYTLTARHHARAAA